MLTLQIAVALYAAAFIAMIAALASANRGVSRAARLLLALGFAAHTIGLIARWAQTGHPPFLNRFESVVFCAWATVLMVMAFEALYRSQLLSLLAIAFVEILLPYAVWGIDSELTHPMPALRERFWLWIHIVSYFIGYAAVVVGTAAAVADIIMRARATQQASFGALSYDRIAHRVVAFAFPFLTVGLVTGAVWAQKAWGQYWSWDPKETWSLITWLLYLVYLHTPLALPRIITAPERRARLVPVLMSIWLVACFGAMLVTYLGLRLLQGAANSLHIYAQ